ncbi:DUF4136 domain-containing protein [candidate division KSB1 bacterium]|nr:DUF4136 domain-containing protein [candidate division KSB1 bacterium]NIR69560.1 DUF4136 domain-containing protein [candidate division KSB1 bacterium]NIS25908.1 DUF4136 domain-containing protein [candidate division KSB1 bacterium]NIT72789.1 DUF4136 domain-containing protein [candidate division KSB1 bacterium]NIU26596.1 DUF4136 domain-containing protein [candidate division KSB1 bacterium]
MKILSCFLTLTGLLFLLSCASLKVKTVHNPEIDFGNYQTFDWITKPENPFEHLTNPVWYQLQLHKVMKTTVDETLVAMGYKPQTENPDFLVFTHRNLKEKVDVAAWGYDYFGDRYLDERVELRRYKQGTLFIDIIDAKTKKLIWRGWAVGAINDPEKAEDKVREAVWKILDEFPRSY